MYRDFPLDQHPWAMRAAIDTSCLSTQSGEGYWKLVDYIHAHAAELGGDEKSLAKANATLDLLTVDEGKRQKVDEAVLNACIAKQDDTVVKATMKEAEALGVDSTPALFINGEKIAGAVPLEYVFRMIDEALIAAGQTPTASHAAGPRAPGGQARQLGKDAGDSSRANRDSGNRFVFTGFSCFTVQPPCQDHVPRCSPLRRASCIRDVGRGGGSDRMQPRP